MNKPEILLLTHGGWGMSLLEGVKMVVGAVDFVKEAALRPQATLDEYIYEVRAAAESLGEGSLILTDMFGGTTTNVGTIVGREKNFKVFCGLNAPMLTEACIELSTDGRLDFEAILEAGKSSVKDVIYEVTKSLQKK